MRKQRNSIGAMRAALVSLSWVLAAASAQAETELVLHVLDEAGVETPARVELLDAEGRAHLAPDALLVRTECLLAPLPEWLAPLLESRHIYNPYTGTDQFYVDGTAHLSLPSGTYRLRAFRGPEYRRSEQTLEVAGDRQEVTVKLERWADPAAKGWYGVDDHLHISRPRRDQNDWIARWMRAEGLHVANLLEMGTAAQISVTPQYAYGDDGAYRDGTLLLLAGQEHPRTHFLGHTITLGSTQRVDNRETYIVYESTFGEGERNGGVSGFAHHGIGNARNGLAISAPTGRVRFMEVLQFEFPYYEVWYQMLNLGVRIAPSAGTDFPCGVPPSIPGRERFYVRVDGPLDRAAFVAAVRAGRTFTSNGPLIELTVNGAQPGDEISLEEPSRVSVTGRVHFDPEQDRVDVVELVMNGVVVHTASEPSAPGEIRLSAEIPVERSAWFALRSSGVKLGEHGPLPERAPQWMLDTVGNYLSGAGGPELVDYLGNMRERASAAHTAAVFVRVAGESSAATGADLAREWLALLAELEDSLSDDRIAEIPIWDWIPYSDGVSEEHLRHNRDALLQAIAQARPFYQRQIREGD